MNAILQPHEKVKEKIVKYISLSKQLDKFTINIDNTNLTPQERLLRQRAFKVTELANKTNEAGSLKKQKKSYGDLISNTINTEYTFLLDGVLLNDNNKNKSTNELISLVNKEWSKLNNKDAEKIINETDVNVTIKKIISQNKKQVAEDKKTNIEIISSNDVVQTPETQNNLISLKNKAINDINKETLYLESFNRQGFPNDFKAVNPNDLKSVINIISKSDLGWNPDGSLNNQLNGLNLDPDAFKFQTIDPSFITEEPDYTVNKLPLRQSGEAMKATPSSTQLLKGDQLDFRKTSFFVPRSYEDFEPSFLSLHSINGSDTSLGKINNNDLPSLDDPFENGYIFNQFCVTGINETYNEKYQLVDTLSEGQILFIFGRRPEVWTLSGLLINDKIHNQVAKFRELWENHIRAGVLANKNQYLKITSPISSIEINCYPLGLSIFTSVENENIVPFNMQFYLRNHKNLVDVEISAFSQLVIDQLQMLTSEKYKTNKQKQTSKVVVAKPDKTPKLFKKVISK